MIYLLIRKEFKEIFRASTMTWLFGGVLVLLGLAIYNGFTYHHTRQQVLSVSQEITYQQFINQGDKNPHIGAHFGFYAFKPAADLGMIDNGLEPFTGNSFYLEPHKRGIVKYKEVSDSTALRSFGFLNIGFFIQFLLPLFIFLICHSSFSKEWENGTIKILLNSNITKGQLIAGKLAACLLIVFTILLLTAGAGFLLLTKENQTADFRHLLGTFLLYMLGASVFALLMTLIACATSLLTRSSVLSLVYLCGFWLLGLFLIPRLAGEISKNIYPPITSVEFEDGTFAEKTYGVGREGTKDERRAMLRDSIMRAYKVARIEDLPVYFIPISIEYFEESDGRVMDRWYSRIDENDARQKKVVTQSSVLSPFIAFRDISMHLCGSDMDTHHNFAESAETHRRRVGELVDDFYQHHTVATKAFWQTIPRFHYVFPAVSYRLQKSLFSIGVISVWLLASLLLLYYSYKTLKV
ncbi:DUF3526 domain-containing protein [Larkinella harenae]